jgi:MFS family permease
MRRAASLPVVLLATTAAQGLATFTVFVLPVLAPQAAADLGVSTQLIGLQMALVYGAASFTSGVAGGALRRWGPARCTQFALAAAAFACVAIALAGLPGIVVGSLATGLGYGLTNPAASQVLSRMTPAHRRNIVFGIKQTGVPLGAALAGLVLPSLALALGWHGAALLVGVVIALITLAYTPLRRDWDRERDPAFPLRAGSVSGLRALRERPGLLGLAIAGGTYSAIQLAFGAFLVTMLVAEFGWTPVAAGFATALVQGMGAGARLAWGWVADRRGNGLATLAAIGFCTALGAVLVPLARTWPHSAVLALLVPLGFCAAGWNGVLIAEADRFAAPGRAGEAVGGVLILSFGGVVVGPSLQAALVSLVGGYAPAFALLALLPLTGAVVAWRTARARP